METPGRGGSACCWDSEPPHRKTQEKKGYPQNKTDLHKFGHNETSQTFLNSGTPQDGSTVFPLAFPFQTTQKKGVPGPNKGQTGKSALKGAAATSEMPVALGKAFRALQGLHHLSGSQVLCLSQSTKKAFRAGIKHDLITFVQSDSCATSAQSRAEADTQRMTPRSKAATSHL